MSFPFYFSLWVDLVRDLLIVIFLVILISKVVIGNGSDCDI